MRKAGKYASRHDDQPGIEKSEKIVFTAKTYEQVKEVKEVSFSNHVLVKSNFELIFFQYRC